MKYLFVASMLAETKTGYWMFPCAVLAENRDQAVGIATSNCQVLFPMTEGYSGHLVAVDAVDPALLNNLNVYQ